MIVLGRCFMLALLDAFHFCFFDSIHGLFMMHILCPHGLIVGDLRVLDLLVSRLVVD